MASSSAEEPSSKRPRVVAQAGALAGYGRGRTAWATVKSQIAKDHPSGPASAEELFEWPLWMARGLAGMEGDLEVTLRLHANLLSTLVWTTDYSGIDCVREGAELGLRGLTELHGWSWEGATPMMFLRSCDIGEVQTGALCRFAELVDNNRSCHFRDLADRLPELAQEFLVAAAPDPKAPLAQRKAANQHISQWLRSNRAWLFPEDAVCACAIHKQDCPVLPPLLSASQWPQAAANSFMADLQARPMDELKGMIRINTAGVTCVGWSQEGLSAGMGHESEVPHAIWLCERIEAFARQQEDIVFVECTPRYPAQERLIAAFGEEAVVISVKTGPECFGWPARRPRVLAAVVNKRTMQWHGPPDLISLEQDFAARFYKGMRLPGSALFVSTEAERANTYVRLAKGRKYNVDSASIQTTDSKQVMRMIFPPGALSRMEEWLGERRRYESDDGETYLTAKCEPTCKGVFSKAYGSWSCMGSPVAATWL